MDIVFGDCVALGGNWSDLLLVDVATIYCWLYGMSYLSSTSITSALEKFKSEAGQLPKRFYSDFDRKLMGGNALLCILANGSNIISAPGGRQSPNELAERTCSTLIRMSREYIYRKASLERILVLRGLSCCNYAQPSYGTFRPENHHTF